MPFNNIEKQRIKKIVGRFCEELIPDHLRNQIKLFYEVRGFEVKIIESRLSFVNSHEWTESPIARLKYNPETLDWEMYWRRSSGKWMKYPGLEPTNHLQSLVYEIVQDPHRVFWG